MVKLHLFGTKAHNARLYCIYVYLLNKLSIWCFSARSHENGPPATPAHPVRAVKEGSPANVINKRHSLTTIPPTVTTSSSAMQRRSLDSSTDTDLLAIGGKTASSLLGQGHLSLSTAITTQLPITMSTEPTINSTPKSIPTTNIPLVIPSVKSESGRVHILLHVT